MSKKTAEKEIEDEAELSVRLVVAAERQADAMEMIVELLSNIATTLDSVTEERAGDTFLSVVVRGKVSLDN